MIIPKPTIKSHLVTKRRKIIKGVAINFALIALMLVMVEFFVILCFAFPSVCRYIPVLKVLRVLYLRGVRNVIQFIPECTKYDKELFYTLKPGSFEFYNLEFKTNYYVNQLGTRDDENSLISPDAVVIGDSFAMGWGVQQDETFAQVIEHKSNLNVLNAAVSSYGTIREMGMLARVDTSALRYLIIQYSDNDFNENKAFLGNEGAFFAYGNKMFHHSLKLYSQRKKRHYFGKYIHTMISGLVGKCSYDETAKFEEDCTIKIEEAEAFVNLLMKSQVNLQDVEIIVTELNSYGNNDSDFVGNLNRIVKSGNYPEYIKNIRVIDSSKILNKKHYFTLDDHINKEGHEVIAGEILKIMQNYKPNSQGSKHSWE